VKKKKRSKVQAIKRLARGKIKLAARRIAKVARVVTVAHIALALPAIAPPESDITATNPDFVIAKAEFPPGHDKRRRRKITYVIRPKRKHKK
jgi:hypothetical protein